MQKNKVGCLTSLSVGNPLVNDSCALGETTHLFGSSAKVSIAVKFVGMVPKIFDLRLALIDPLDCCDE